MILILLASILAAAADPDYYAVHIQGDGGRYKMFTKISKCKEAVYHSGDNRVLFQDRVWKIGTLKNDQIVDCKTLPSIVEEEYRMNKRTQRPKSDIWIDIDGDTVLKRILIDGFNKSVEVTDKQLVAGTKVDAESKEVCLRKDWGKKYPDKHIVVAFQDSNCFYDFVDQAELVDVYGAIIFVHPAGKNKIRMILKLKLKIIDWRIDNDRTTTERSNGTDREKDGGIQIFVIVIVVLALVVVAGVASFLIKKTKDWRIKQTTETEEFNENYGNLDTEQYYEEEKKSTIVHSNDYY